MSCLSCGFETKNPKFCSRRCSAIYNNIRYPKRRQQGLCKKCSISITSSRTYCNSCWNGSVSIKENKISEWLSGNWDGGKNKLSQTIRNYLLEKFNYTCIKCGFNTPHPDDGKTILEINHIDGNGTNHSEDNLEVICPNCHALTSSYRGRNYGSGRPVYYLRRSSE